MLKVSSILIWQATVADKVTDMYTVWLCNELNAGDENGLAFSHVHDIPKSAWVPMYSGVLQYSATIMVHAWIEIVWRPTMIISITIGL